MNRIKSDAYINALLTGQDVEPGAIDLIVEAEMKKVPIDYYRMTADEVKNLKYRFDIDVTGESIDIPKKIETYTTLYQTALQEGDMATAQYAKKQIMILAGEKMPNIPMGQPQIQGQVAGASPMGGQTEQVMASQPGGQE
jgi:ABC-type transport system substrate-binding protein